MQFIVNLLYICLKKTENQGNLLLVYENDNCLSLQKFLKEKFHNLTWNDKFTIALQLAHAVQYLHENGIVHKYLVIYQHFSRYILLLKI